MANFTSLLISLCSIQEKSLSKQGYEQVEAWSDIATDVPTRKDRANSVKSTDTEMRENNDDDLFFFNPDVNITRGNRINFDSDLYDVLKVNKVYDSQGVHHLEVIARFVDHK